MKLHNIINPSEKLSRSYNIETKNGVIESVEQRPLETKPPDLLLPTLCHPHVHLDKAYLLRSRWQGIPDGASESQAAGDTDNRDKKPDSQASGDFSQALRNTWLAKKNYTVPDLLARGHQLIATSYRQGVTSMRAFVEVDEVTGIKTLEAAVALKKQFQGQVEVQICVFAQEALYSGPQSLQGTRRRLIADALETYMTQADTPIGCLGSAPYVEATHDAAVSNIEWTTRLALRWNLHLDFHLDYSLTAPSLVPAVVRALHAQGWPARAAAAPGRTVALGHCTRLTRLTGPRLRDLAELVVRSGLPVHFVGLPSSDVFMMARPGRDGAAADPDAQPHPHARERGTLPVLALIREHGLMACIGVNNVGNAFTPYGSGDPLQLASWCVGLYQAGSAEDAKVLFECVSSRARAAIGLSEDGEGEEDVDGVERGAFEEGNGMGKRLMIENRAVATGTYDPEERGLAIPGPVTIWQDFKDVVWDPPETCHRTVVGGEDKDVEVHVTTPRPRGQDKSEITGR